MWTCQDSERRQLSCWEICQNITSAAELFSELSAENFGSAELYTKISAENYRCWTVQWTVRTSLLPLSFKRIISRELRLLSCSANYQQSTSAVELYRKLSEQHFSCWVIRRIIRTTRKLPCFSTTYQNRTPTTELFSELSEKHFSCPQFFSLQAKCWGTLFYLPVCWHALCTNTTAQALLFQPSPLAERPTQCSFDFMLHSEHPWVFLSSEGNLSSSEP